MASVSKYALALSACLPQVLRFPMRGREGLRVTPWNSPKRPGPREEFGKGKRCYDDRVMVCIERKKGKRKEGKGKKEIGTHFKWGGCCDIEILEEKSKLGFKGPTDNEQDAQHRSNICAMTQRDGPSLYTRRGREGKDDKHKKIW